MVEQSDAAYLIYVIPFAVTLAILFLYAWRLGRSDKAANGAYAALHSPSVTQARNAFDRRVAIAVREAKLGFHECAGCGFANAQRAPSCVLCGVALGRSGSASRRRFWSFGRQKENTASSDPLGGLNVGISERQQRVRKRKDWVREVDVHGRAIWCHGEQTLPDTAAFPSYVLQSVGPEQSLANDSKVNPDVTQDVCTSTISAPPLSDQCDPAVEVVVHDAVEPLAPLRTIVDVTQTLDDELKALTVDVVDATTADAAHIAFASTARSLPSAPTTHSIFDSINSTQLDFPTKLAHFITSMASRFSHTTETGDVLISRLAIARESLLADSIVALTTMSAAAAGAAVRVEFVGEQGIDAGGVYREWFLLLNEHIVKPSAGIFVCVDERDQTFYINPHSKALLGEHHLAHFFAAGRLLGRALLEGNVTGFHLALPLLKIILGLPVGFHDLAYFDPEAYKNLRWLLENDGVDMLGLDFTVTEKQPDGTTRQVDLLPNGSQLDVTDANKHEYIDCKLQYHLFGSVQTQLYAFLKGLYEIVPAELLVLFDAEELDYVLSGSDEIDVDDWERNTVTSENLGYYPADELFWKVVHDLSQDERRRLLQFATGSTRVPPGGFSALTSNDGQLCLFTLRGVVAKETRGYLHSHACFNRVDLPMHKNVQDMREAVLAAIAGASVGFTTD